MQLQRLARLGSPTVRRALWFVAGAGTGVYTMAKARRLAEALTPEGLSDRLSGLAVGAHLFREEVRAGMGAKETQLRDRLGLPLDGERASGTTDRGLGTGQDTGRPQLTRKAD